MAVVPARVVALRSKSPEGPAPRNAWPRTAGRADAGPVHPRCGRGRAGRRVTSSVIDQWTIASALPLAFDVAHQAATLHQVGEEVLDDPPWGRHHEAAPVVAAFDDRQDQGERGQAVTDEAAGAAAVGPHQLQPVVRVGHLRRQDPGSGALPRRWAVLSIAMTNSSAPPSEVPPEPLQKHCSSTCAEPPVQSNDTVMPKRK
ncbi:hypothetical protein [Streptomyces sp. NWU339]|uniref:hypothetical protein n=1 Tax=Streptomyces sp. NWU339 TaxID=2185284 RepID=UPI00215A20CC|nr:hypothetical protein [Streptomyces sp. NWU339]